MKPEESALRKYAEDLLAGDVSQVISMHDYDYLELMARRSAHEFEATNDVYGLPAYYFRVSSDQTDYYTAATLPIGGQAQLTRQAIPSIPRELEPQPAASPESPVIAPTYAEPVKTLKTHQQRKELLALRIHELYTTTDMDDVKVRHQTDYRIVFGNKQISTTDHLLTTQQMKWWSFVWLFTELFPDKVNKTFSITIDEYGQTILENSDGFYQVLDEYGQEIQ